MNLVTTRGEATRQPEGRRHGGIVRRAADWCLRHPVATVAIVTALVAILHAAWIWHHRLPGTFNVDEAAYAGDALNHHHRMSNLAIPFRLLYSGAHAPLIPFVSSFLMFVGPVDPRTALLIQPLLLIAVAAGIAHLTTRLAGPVTAIAAGMAFVVLPTTVSATQSYWFGLGHAALVCGGLAALLWSDHGENRRIWLYCLAVSLTPITRTMAIAYLPALILAGLVHVWPSRRGRKRLAVGLVVTAAVVPLPILALNYRDVFGYLGSSGYGSINDELFPDRAIDRPMQRFMELQRDVGGPVVWLLLCAVALGAVVWRRNGGRLQPFLGTDWAPLVVLVAGGYAALLSTSNKGDWFELPLLAVATTLCAASIARLPRMVVGIVMATISGLAVLTLGNAWWWFTPSDDVRAIFLDRYGYGVPETSDGEDPRFVPSRRSEQNAAAEEWWTLIEQMQLRFRALADPATDIDFKGSATLLNVNLLGLAEEWRGPPRYASIPIQVEDFGCDESDRDGREKVIAVPVGDSPDWARIEANETARLARDNCWEEIDRVPMPRHGDIVFYRYPPR